VHASDSDGPIRRELHFLRLYAAASTVAIAVLFLLTLWPRTELALDTLRVARIDVLNESGDPALVIGARGRLPGPWFEGREYPQELSGGRTRATGMIFFNERGDEVGGLTYHGQLAEDGYRAGGGVTFDQFRQDQVVSLQYQDNGTNRSAGLQVWDRSTEISLQEILELAEARRTATGAEREAVEAEIRGLAERGLAAHRVFLGSQDRTAVLLLRDRSGRTRVRLLVDSLDTPRLEFLDPSGGVVSTYPN
jgi:hypothetical protein